VVPLVFKRNVTISVKGLFTALSPRNTRLTHEQVFSFTGLFYKVVGFLARQKAQRRHMETFKRFAETQRWPSTAA
jgi:hypothetical protein